MDAFCGCFGVNSEKAKFFINRAIVVSWAEDKRFYHNEGPAYALNLKKIGTSLESQATFPPKLHGGSWIVGDVLLDNRLEICRELFINPTDFSFGDDLLLLLAYKKLGVSFLKKVKGAFSFAIWDSAKQQILCAKDPVGRYSFFFHLNDKYEFYFASTIRPLVENPAIPKLLNKDYLLKLAAFDFSSKDQSMYSHINKLKPGQFLTFDSRSLKKKQVLEGF